MVPLVDQPVCCSIPRPLNRFVLGWLYPFRLFYPPKLCNVNIHLGHLRLQLCGLG